MASATFPKKLVTMDIRPEHVGMKKGHNEIISTIAEWYVIGLGKKLIVNRIGGTREHKNDLYHGRVSGFPKTSWVYHLKHFVYDAGRCEKYSLPFDGIWDDLRTKQCQASTLLQGRTKIEQPHLDLIKDSPLDFLFASWEEEGTLVRSDASSSIGG
jgi:hypothetical protein